MEINKILSADLLDLLFDERNKDYGAYQLRKTYNKRITKAVIVTFTVAGLVLAGTVLASSLKPKEDRTIAIKEVTIEDLAQEEPEPLPEPERPPQEQQVQTEQFVNLRVVEDNEVVEPPPTQDDLVDSRIGDRDQEGVIDNKIEEPPTPPEVGKGLVDIKPREPEIWEKVEVDAKFKGDWPKFLLRNLRGEVPVENGAPAGRHMVIIQFVVDVDGTVSDIRPLTNIGFGMEEEAIRVLKKSDKWTPAFQNTQHVKAYRRQSIVFEVLSDE